MNASRQQSAGRARRHETPPPPGPVSAAVILAAGLLAGCANILQQYYAASPGTPPAALAPSSGTTRLYGSADVAVDGSRLLQDGFAQIGALSFKTSGRVTIEQIHDLAAQVGADIVVCSKTALRTHKAVVPFDPPKGGTAGAASSYVHVEGGLTYFGRSYGGTQPVGGGVMDFKGNVTSSGIPGISAEDMAAINGAWYVFTATFWRRKAPASAGP